MSDDFGVIEGDAETVWHFGFPREKPEDVSRALANLRDLSRVVLYRGDDGVECIHLPYFNKHQKIDHPTPSKLPTPPKDTTDSRIIRDDSRALAKTRAGLDWMGGDRNGEEGRGSEGIQGEVAPTGAPALAPSKPVRSTSPQEATARRLGTALGSTINICRKQVAALVANGWDLPRIGRAIEAHARPGMAPWEWTRRAQGENGTAKGGASVERILWMADQAEEAGK